MTPFLCRHCSFIRGVSLGKIMAGAARGRKGKNGKAKATSGGGAAGEKDASGRAAAMRGVLATI